MKNVINVYGCLLLTLLVGSCQTVEESKAPENGISPADSPIVLQNNLLEVRIEQYGGHFTGLELKSNPINPLTWALTAEQMPANNKNGAPFMGHFLCLGRWGGPSEGEIAAGIPHNGEQSNTLWQISSLNETEVIMSNEAPLDGLSVQRRVSLLEDEPAFLVEERFVNTHSLGRVSNVVQHVTLGPPFLSLQTLFNSNAKQGFNQKLSYPDPHAYAYEWPNAIIDTTANRTNDLRRNDQVDNFVSTHLFDNQDKFGWVSAYDPKSGNLLAYVWRLEEYPWINIWSHFINDQAFAKGLEFGTTGIGRPYQSLLERDTRFHGVNSWEYMDAGQKKDKTYLCFMLDLEPDLPNPTLNITEADISVNGQRILANPL